jgi:hypothetical protein
VSTLAIVLIVIVAVLLLLLLAGYLTARRRQLAMEDDLRAKVAQADRALEQARAQDRGWDRAVLESACRDALRSERPNHEYEEIDLVLVDDRPGVVDDRAHLVARGGHGRHARIILGRREGGDWTVERVE